MTMNQAAQDYGRVAAAIDYLAAHHHEQPDLGDLAAALGSSEFHLQRLFRRWVGISPKRFLQFLTREHAKTLLRQSRDLLDAAWESGLSGPSRLHDLMVAGEAVTPGEYKRRGEGVTIRYGVHDSPFGAALLGCTERGICTLAFLEGEDPDAAAMLRDMWPGATLRFDPGHTGALAGRIFGAVPSPGEPLRIWVQGTNFQLKVWEALMRIPPGRILSYEDVAASLGRPGSARAVAGAVARNPVAYLIPCHRVIRANGMTHGYRWGTTRKQAILGWEAARSEVSG